MQRPHVRGPSRFPLPSVSASVGRPWRWAAAVGLAVGVVGGGLAAGRPSGAGAAPETPRPQPRPDLEVAATWTRVPLREWARSVARLTGATLVVDRRLDPDTPITRDCRGEPLGRLLDAVAAAAESEVVWLARSVRLVPRGLAAACGRAERCREAALAGLPPPLRRIVAAPRTWSWPDGAVPRDLVADAAAAATVSVTGLDDLPHDHLPASDLPPLSLGERLDLLLAHYDRRIDWRRKPGDGLEAAIVPLDSAVDPGPMAAAPAPIDPPRPPRPGGRKPGAKTGATRYTLRLAAPLDQALGAIAGRLGLELALDRASLAARGIAAGEIVRVEVTDVSRDELLDALVGPLSLTWRIEGGRLMVSAPARD